jgi:hypothetical protein
MYDFHHLQETEHGLQITHNITVTGILTFLWVRLVAKNVAKTVPKQLDNLVAYVQELK